MYPNWAEINKLDNGMLRVALYTAEGTERERLEAAFPECYTNDSDAIKPVPVSALQTRSEEIHRKDPTATPSNYLLNKGLDWTEAAKEFGIPVAFEFSDPEMTLENNALPDEVWRQLKGQEIRGGVKITYHGEELIAILFKNYSSSRPMKVGDILTEFPKEYIFTFVHAQFIDLDS